MIYLNLHPFFVVVYSIFIARVRRVMFVGMSLDKNSDAPRLDTFFRFFAVCFRDIWSPSLALHFRPLVAEGDPWFPLFLLCFCSATISETIAIYCVCFNFLSGGEGRDHLYYWRGWQLCCTIPPWSNRASTQLWWQSYCPHLFLRNKWEKGNDRVIFRRLCEALSVRRCLE